MAKDEKRQLTEEQRAALKPSFEKMARAYDELERAVANLSPDNPDPGLGFCMSCPEPGRDELCSSFLGPGRTLRERCQREFCQHPLMHHI